jgi:hypothetical protein
MVHMVTTALQWVKKKVKNSANTGLDFCALNQGGRKAM